MRNQLYLCRNYVEIMDPFVVASWIRVTTYSLQSIQFTKFSTKRSINATIFFYWGLACPQLLWCTDSWNMLEIWEVAQLERRPGIESITIGLFLTSSISVLVYSDDGTFAMAAAVAEHASKRVESIGGLRWQTHRRRHSCDKHESTTDSCIYTIIPCISLQVNYVLCFEPRAGLP